MSDKPAVTPDGYCTNTKPVSGTIEQVNGHALGGKFFKMHGRRYAHCPCGRRPSLTDRGKLRRHKPPRESPPQTPSTPLPRYGGVDGRPGQRATGRLPPRARTLPFGECGAARPLSPPGRVPRSRSP